MSKEKILALANHIGRKKTGAKDAYTYTDPEYLILEPVVTDDMADVCMQMKIRIKYTAKDVAPLCKKTEEETYKLLLELADVGVCLVHEVDGVDYFWYELWVPGIMEMMVNKKENVRKYPQIARAFEAYGRIRGPQSAGNFPVGVGLMRVIPIETAIEGETRRASYEEISKYLDGSDVFSVSDCSCRTSREIMGEGCGHLKEDMCIQIGYAAEYYIRTGRGRKVTRDEVNAILRCAEENGLMHQIPNTDGSGHTHAVCNCCGCSCFALRTTGMFQNADMSRSNYVSHVDKDKCVACGECVAHCPVNAVQLGQKLCSSKPVVESLVRKETPRNTNWTADKWNIDYRINKKNVVDTGTSPCKTKCPAHIAIQGYIKLAAEGRYTEALELIKRENPFPAVCGRICPRGCESECTRADVDEPIAIDEIKKFIAEKDLSAKDRYIPQRRHEYGKKIAVIGAGPSGLSCAYYLAIDGYKVTVFEKQAKLGGMLTLGIPSFRLGKDVVNAEIDILREMGVEFKTGIEVGKDISISGLRNDGYKAFYVAIGAQGGRKLGIEGENAAGVVTGVDFLRNVNLGKDEKLSGSVAVIGGGNVAIDVARTAVRSGAAKVSLYCLESRSEMPALAEEIAEAEAEGIEIHNSWGPNRIIEKDGKAHGIEFKKCVSVFDKEGKFKPFYDESNVMTADTDTILLSIGQSIEWGNLLKDTKVECNSNHTIKADSVTLQTAESDVFAGGDAFTGPKFAIDAIALGKEAAVSIHRFVQPGQSLIFGRDRREYRAFDKDSLELDGYDKMPRQSTGHTDGVKAKETFSDLRGVFTEEQLKNETERCLGCGSTVVDEFICVGCGQCTTKCKFGAISLVRKYNAEGVAFEGMKPLVVKQMIKRKFKIALKNLTRPFVNQ